MNFGEMVLDFRVKHNLTQQKVADLFGVSKNMVSRYEKGTDKPNARHRIVFEQKMKEWEEKKND